MEKKQVFTIPNLLCVFRILLVPVFVVLYLRAEDFVGQLIAASIIAVAGITDFLDGFIARKFNLVSEVGKIIDPLADKLLQAGIAIALMFRIPYMWVLFTVFVVKELTMFVFQAYLYKRGKKLPGALWYGKVATTVFYVMMIVLLFIPNHLVAVQYLLMFIVGGFLVMAFVLYMIVLVRMYHEMKRERAAARIAAHIDGRAAGDAETDSAPTETAARSAETDSSEDARK